MIYNTGIITLPLTQRKQALEEMITEMSEYYALTRQELFDFNLWLLAPDELQVDLLIHMLNLYAKEVLDHKFIDSILQDNTDLVTQYKSGNTKTINTILGKILAKDKSIDPKQCMNYLKEIL